jgi:hypothetical protein
MKRITAIAFFAAASFLGGASALAQDSQLRATVPFNFTVGSKHLPAGNYTVSPVFATVIAIRNWDKNAAVLSAVKPGADQSNSNAKLVFDKLGDQYFLREIFGGYGNSSHGTLPLSKSEQTARSLESRPQPQRESGHHRDEVIASAQCRMPRVSGLIAEFIDSRR